MLGDTTWKMLFEQIFLAEQMQAPIPWPLKLKASLWVISVCQQSFVEWQSEYGLEAACPALISRLWSAINLNFWWFSLKVPIISCAFDSGPQRHNSGKLLFCKGNTSMSNSSILILPPFPFNMYLRQLKSEEESWRVCLNIFQKINYVFLFSTSKHSC